MLKKRIITICFILPVVIWLITTAEIAALAFIMFNILLISIWEWLNLAKITSNFFRIINFCSFLSITGLAVACPNIWFVMINLSVLVWLLAVPILIIYPKGRAYWQQPITIIILGHILLPTAILSFIAIRNIGDTTPILLITCSIVWATDCGAFFFGKKWGKTKLIPQVSPNKTWLGIGGAILVAFTVATGYWLYWQKQITFLNMLLICLAIVIISIVGDLLESLLKRVRDIKDSGNIFPGHGGMLDRIDSLLAVLPCVLWGLLQFGEYQLP